MAFLIKALGWIATGWSIVSKLFGTAQSQEDKAVVVGRTLGQSETKAATQGEVLDDVQRASKAADDVRREHLLNPGGLRDDDGFKRP